MPSMPEIYNSYSFEYDELVSHEDYQNNLQNAIFEIVDFNNKTVIEAGIGTGRVTKLYIDKAKKVFGLDISNHMMNRAKDNLKEHLEKITFHQYDNLSIDNLQQKSDIVIEGWSFGHTVLDHSESIHETIKSLVSECEKSLNENGTILIIETLGSGISFPKAPDPGLEKFYFILENEFGFNKKIVETDYKFNTPEEADRIFKFFFGKTFEHSVSEDNKVIIPEFTGIWYR